ncbi:MAG: MBL fold metallo-hydrolase [Deltaproteobacteria bacterium]|nr:MBL fold metallo-hydrolase [Deltaproteobacteria bacterium]
MNIIEQTFQRIEYEKFLLNRYRKIPAETEKILQDKLHRYKYRIDVRNYFSRLSLLKREASEVDEHSSYAKQYGVRGVRKFFSTNGEVIYRIPVLSFPGDDWRSHFTNCYLIVGKQVVLIDCGTTFSEKGFEEGMGVVRNFYGEDIGTEDIDSIIITHGHVDHFAGLSFLYPKCNADIMVHEMDAEAVEEVGARHRMVHHAIKEFLQQSGMPEARIKKLVDLHRMFKADLKGVPVTQRLSDGDRIINDYEIIHTPGHCPGAICIKVGDVMFLGDHILNEITPHQSPKFYMKGMGLIHYIPSLLKVYANTRDVCIGLPAHNDAVPSIKTRTLEIIDMHHERLGSLLMLLTEPKNIYDLTNQYFSEIEGRELKGYDYMLAVEEIGAHLEYLVETLKCVEVTTDRHDKKGVFLFRKSA